jgi:predicted nucleic acid-binding protein
VFDKAEVHKRAKAIELLRKLRHSPEEYLLLWQVAAECFVQLRIWSKQKRIPPTAPQGFISNAKRSLDLTMPSFRTIEFAMRLGDRYSLSQWDSMLLGACIEAGVTRLYTEDMGAPRRIESIELVNPFLA